MKRLVPLVGWFAWLTIGAAACNGTVLNDGADGDMPDDDGAGGENAGGGGGSGGAPTVSSSSTGMIPPPPSPAISMLYGELESHTSTSSSGQTTGSTSNGGGSTVASVSSGSTIDPDTLVIFLGSQLQVCEDPHASDCNTPSWRVLIHLPTTHQAVGTYALDGLANFSETIACGSGGGGTYWEGTIQVTAIDEDEIEFTLSGTNPFFEIEGNADGSYTAPRCF